MTTSRPRVVLVAAVADNGVIGNGGQLPWHLPEDLAHFRRVTTGNVVIMGRRTYDSIGRPLPRRTNIVVTRQRGWTADGVLVASGIEGALALAGEHDGEAMVIGGAEIYALALPLADAQILTEVHCSPAGDVLYPAFDRAAWTETRREKHESHDFVWWVRGGLEPIA
jgi:dihydrofolate reductase